MCHMFTLIIASSATEGASIGWVSVTHEKLFYYAEMRLEAVNALLSALLSTLLPSARGTYRLKLQRPE